MADSGTTHESFERTESCPGFVRSRVWHCLYGGLRPDWAMAIALGQQCPLVGLGDRRCIPARCPHNPQDDGTAEPRLDAFRPAAPQNR